MGDVDPIEIVCWLPTLCKKMDVPYAIIKSKSRLGLIVHKKTTAALAILGVKKEDAHVLNKLVEVCKDSHDAGQRPQWRGGLLGPKDRMRHEKQTEKKTPDFVLGLQ